MYKEINSYMKQLDKSEKAFICKHDIVRTSSEKSRISIALWSHHPDDKRLSSIQRNVVLILSCLIFIGPRTALPCRELNAVGLASRLQTKIFHLNRIRWT
jgi:hypothetical protein